MNRDVVAVLVADAVAVSLYPMVDVFEVPWAVEYPYKLLGTQAVLLGTIH